LNFHRVLATKKEPHCLHGGAGHRSQMASPGFRLVWSRGSEKEKKREKQRRAETEREREREEGVGNRKAPNLRVEFDPRLRTFAIGYREHGQWHRWEDRGHGTRDQFLYVG
jgi:hypothetical protein